MAAIKISEVLDMTWDDFNKMDRAQLAKVAQAAAKATNQRLQNLKRADEYSPARQSLETYMKDKNPNLTLSRGKNVNELRKDVSRMLQFLNSSTSTVAGARRYNQEALERIVKRKEGESKREFEMRKREMKGEVDFKKFWEVYHKTIERNPELLTMKMFGSDRIQQILLNEAEKGNYDIEDIEDLENALSKMEARL